MRQRALLSLLLLTFAVPVAARRSPSPQPAATVPLILVEHLNQLRTAEGLPALRHSPLLEQAAQAHADDMTARRYYGFTSPDGEAIEDWITEVGYHARLVTEKLVHSDLPAERIVDGWRQQPDRNRASVLHPEVEEIGIGVGAYLGIPVYAIAVARPSEQAMVLRTDREREKLFRQLTDRPGVLREQLRERVNSHRLAAGLPRLRTEPRLDRAAQAHAEALAAEGVGTAAVSEPDRQAALFARIAAAGYQATHASQLLASGLVTAAEAVDGWIEDSGTRGALISSVPLDLGVGLAADPEAGVVHWVLVFARGE